jgi:gamma-glutamyltranspeptidase
MVVTESLAELAAEKPPQMTDAPGFIDNFAPGGQALALESLMKQPTLAATFEQLAKAGLNDFYRGELGKAIGDELSRLGSPLTAKDFTVYHATQVAPLDTRLRGARIFNLPPPTPGLASLMILGIFDRLGVTEAEGFDYIHGLVEATKQAFRVRNRMVTDPDHLPGLPANYLTPSKLAELSAKADPRNARCLGQIRPCRGILPGWVVSILKVALSVLFKALSGSLAPVSCLRTPASASPSTHHLSKRWPLAASPYIRSILRWLSLTMAE